MLMGGTEVIIEMHTYELKSDKRAEFLEIFSSKSMRLTLRSG
jgi:hypothetical protein